MTTINELKQKLNEVTSAHPLTVDIAKLCCGYRELLEACIDYIFEKSNVSKPKNASLLELIDNPAVLSYIDDLEIVSSLHYVRIVGMNALHGRTVRKKEAKLAQSNIANLVNL